MKILFVHGRSQENKDPDALLSEWLDALAKGCRQAGIAPPASGDVALPYYGNLLAKLSTGASAPLSDDIRVRGDGDPDVAFDDFQRLFLDEMRHKAAISDADVERELDALSPAIRERGARNWEWVQAVLRAIDAHLPGLSRKLLEWVTRDVWVYLTMPGVRDAIDGLVEAELTGAPTVVVGHSLGSVVAYSILRRRARHVPRLVTLGSPLGLHAVRDQFRPLKFPVGVADWFNAYDERDVVALRGLDATTFPVTPAVRNRSDVNNTSADRHAITSYLADPVVAREICTV